MIVMILNSHQQHIPRASATRASFDQTLWVNKLGQMTGCNGAADFSHILTLPTTYCVT
ncbi:hypothetical protein ACRWQN_02615 [Shewanella sp. HL-SH8]|uniref:hypothetical protein n=1 Tax=Shewanella sp. HL-SH8 TaxID=3436242 RepID=UPI003EBAAC06